MENIELDVHTHTIASGHAYSSLSEMVAGAKEKDIKLLGIVEHDQGIPGTCAPIYFKNLDVIPREIEGIKLLLGIEINILDHQGRLSYMIMLITAWQEFIYIVMRREQLKKIHGQ